VNNGLRPLHALSQCHSHCRATATSPSRSPQYNGLTYSLPEFEKMKKHNFNALQHMERSGAKTPSPLC
jgi:hypothetical protein